MDSFIVVLSIVTAVFGAAALVLLVLLWRRGTDAANAAAIAGIAAAVDALGPSQERVERTVRGEFANARNESAERGRLLRQEIGTSSRAANETMFTQMGTLGRLQREQFDSFAAQLRVSAEGADARQKQQGEALDASIAALAKAVTAELAAFKAETAAGAQGLKGEVAQSLDRFGRLIQEQMAQLFHIQAQQHEGLTARLNLATETQEKRGRELREMVEAQLGTLRAENEKKLEEMRQTVDEKLQGTLEKRLGDSFKLVSERLEAVHKGLGEVQTLASGVGDLKRVLTNVKSRGSWGEVALGNLLDQVLTPEQYTANAQIKPHSAERVEFAIRLPGRDDDNAEVLLAIDAKFPTEDYERLQHAADAADRDGVEQHGRGLELRIRAAAADIAGKYIDPPRTTDFAIMFLPTEGLYAEIIRRPGLCDDLQRQHRVIVAGPTTLAALLNALQMGFRSLAIQKRSSEVWQVLSAVKAEFDKFGPVLEKVKKKLQEASNTIDAAGQRQRAIRRKLQNVEAMPAPEAAALLGMAADLAGDDDEDAPVAAAG